MPGERWAPVLARSLVVSLHPPGISQTRWKKVREAGMPPRSMWAFMMCFLNANVLLSLCSQQHSEYFDAHSHRINIYVVGTFPKIFGSPSHTWKIIFHTRILNGMFGMLNEPSFFVASPVTFMEYTNCTSVYLSLLLWVIPKPALRPLWVNQLYMFLFHTWVYSVPGSVLDIGKRGGKPRISVHSVNTPGNQANSI